MLSSTWVRAQFQRQNGRSQLHLRLRSTLEQNASFCCCFKDRTTNKMSRWVKNLIVITIIHIRTDFHSGISGVFMMNSNGGTETGLPTNWTSSYSNIQQPTRTCNKASRTVTNSYCDQIVRKCIVQEVLLSYYFRWLGRSTCLYIKDTGWTLFYCIGNCQRPVFSLLGVSQHIA